MSDFSSLKNRSSSQKKNLGRSANSTQNISKRKPENKQGSGLRTVSGARGARRVLAPASLPSLKSENSGNDPTVSIVPSGGSGWKNVEKVDQGNSTAVSTATTRSSPAISQSQPTASSATIPNQESDQNDSTSNQTVWSGGPVVPESKVVQSNRPLSQREFPALGGAVETDDHEPDERNAYRQEQNQPQGTFAPEMSYNMGMPDRGMMYPPRGFFQPNFNPGIGHDPRYMRNENFHDADNQRMFNQSNNLTNKYQSPTVNERIVIEDETSDEGWAGHQEEMDFTDRICFDTDDTEDDEESNSEASHKSSVNKRSDEQNISLRDGSYNINTAEKPKDTVQVADTIAHEVNKGNSRPVPHQAWHQPDDNIKVSPTGSNRANDQGSPVKPRGRTDVAVDEWSNPDEELQKDKTISRTKFDISKESIEQARRRHEEEERKLKEDQAKAAQAKLKELERKCHNKNNDGTTRLPDTGHPTDTVTENLLSRNVYSEFSTQKHDSTCDSKQQGFRRTEGKFRHPPANPRKGETAPFQLLRRNTSESNDYKDSTPDKEESHSFSEVKCATSVDSVANDDISPVSNEAVTIAKKPPVMDAGLLDSSHSMVKVDETLENLDDIKRDSIKNTANAGASKNVSVTQHQKKPEKHYGYYHDDYEYQYYGGESYNGGMGRSNQKYRGRGNSKRGYPPRQPYDNRPYSNPRRYGRDYNHDQSGKRQPGQPRRTNERNQRNFKSSEKYEKQYDNTTTELAKSETKSAKPVQSNARTSSSFSSRGSSNDDRMLELPMIDSDNNQLETALSDGKHQNLANVLDIGDQSAHQQKDNVVIDKLNDEMSSEKTVLNTEDDNDSSLGIEKITLSDDTDRSVMSAVTDKRRNNAMEKSVIVGDKEPYAEQESLQYDHEIMYVKDGDTSDRESLNNSDKVGITAPNANEQLFKDNMGKSLKGNNVVPISGRKERKQDSCSVMENAQGKVGRFSKTKHIGDVKGRNNKRNYNRDYDYDGRSYRNDKYKSSYDKGVSYQGSQRQHEQTKISHREDLSVTVPNDKEAQRIVVSERQYGKSIVSSAKSDNAKRRNERYPQSGNRRNYEEDDQHWRPDWQRHNRNVHSNSRYEGKRYEQNFHVNKNLTGKPPAAKFDRSGGKSQNRNYSDYGGRTESAQSYNRSNKRVEESKSSKRDRSHYGDTSPNYEGRREDFEITNYSKTGNNRTNESKVKGETGGYSRNDIDQTFNDHKGKGKSATKDPVDTSNKGLAEVSNKRKGIDRQRNDNERSSQKLSYDNVHAGSAVSSGQQRELLEKSANNQKLQENTSAKAIDKNLVGKGNVIEYKEQANDPGNNDQVERAWDKPLETRSFAASTLTRQTKSQHDEKTNQKKTADITEIPLQNPYSNRDVSHGKNSNIRHKHDKSTTDEKSIRKSVFAANEADSYKIDKSSFKNNLESDRKKVTEKNNPISQNPQMSKDIEDRNQNVRYKSEKLKHKNDERTDKKKVSERNEYMGYYPSSNKDLDDRGHKIKKTNTKPEMELYQPKPRRERDYASRNDFKNTNFKNKNDKNMQVDTKRAIKAEDSQYQEQRRNINSDNLGGNVHPTPTVAGSTSHQFTDSDKAVSPPKKRTGEILKSASSVSNSCSDTTEQATTATNGSKATSSSGNQERFQAEDETLVRSGHSTIEKEIPTSTAESDTKGSDSSISKHASTNSINQSEKERTDNIPTIESTPSSQSVVVNKETSTVNPINITGKQWSTNARITTGKANTKPGIDSGDISILESQKDVPDGGITDSMSVHAPVSAYKTQNNPVDYVQKANQLYYNPNKQKITNVSPTAVGTPKQLMQGQQYSTGQHDQMMRQSTRLTHHPRSQHLYQSTSQSQRVDAITNPNMVNHSLSMPVNMSKSNLALSNANYSNPAYGNKKIEYQTIQSMDHTHHSLLPTAAMHAQQSQSPGMHSQPGSLPWQVEQTNNPVQSTVGLRGPTVHDGISQVQAISYIEKQHKPHAGSYEAEVSPMFGNTVDSLNNSNPRVPSPGVNTGVSVNIQNSSYRDYSGQNFTGYQTSQQLTATRNFNMQPTVSTYQTFVMPISTVVGNSNQAIAVVNPQQGNISMPAGTTRPIGPIHSTAGIPSVPYRPAAIGGVVGQTSRIAPDVQGMDQIVTVPGVHGIITDYNINQQGQLQVRASKNPTNRGNKPPYERQNSNNMQRQKQRGDAYRHRKG